MITHQTAGELLELSRSIAYVPLGTPSVNGNRMSTSVHVLPTDNASMDNRVSSIVYVLPNTLQHY